MPNSMNPVNGAEFEGLCKEFFVSQGLELTRPFVLPIGISESKKDHKFDLGSEVQKVIVECKRHTWTKGKNAPSAKMTIWNEAMYYFHIAPAEYRKILFVLRDYRRGQTLAQYYISRHKELIPDGVEIWEYDLRTQKAEEVYQSGKHKNIKKDVNKKEKIASKVLQANSCPDKYLDLLRYLQNSNSKALNISFTKLNAIVDLPPSAYKYKAWWSNGGHHHACAWLEAGWEVSDINLGKNIKFLKVASQPKSTEPGYINKNNQKNLGKSDPVKSGTDHCQYAYILQCALCGHVYGANGSDIHLRKCPKCQRGRPGIPLYVN